MKWVALFSQTGLEILQVSEQLNRAPDLIITNQPINSQKINPRLLEKYQSRIVSLDKKPRIIDYIFLLHGADIITLHGWLRIIPREVCEQFKIYNGHPGLINKYPELKGKDPQKRAWEGKYKEIGCVIHEVIPAVDEGNILQYNSIENTCKTLDELYNILHDTSTKLWVDFLAIKLKEGI